MAEVKGREGWERIETRAHHRCGFCIIKWGARIGKDREGRKEGESYNINVPYPI